MITLNDFLKWFRLINFIQHYMNNFKNVFIGKTFNEIIYEFTFVRISDLNISIFSDFIMLYKLNHFDAADVIAFVQTNAIKIYDKKHQIIHFQIKQWILLRLHKKYNISFTIILNHKLFQQYADFFKIVKRVKNLIYRLKFWKYWRIHSIFMMMMIFIRRYATD